MLQVFAVDVSSSSFSVTINLQIFFHQLCSVISFVMFRLYAAVLLYAISTSGSKSSPYDANAKVKSSERRVLVGVNKFAIVVLRVSSAPSLTGPLSSGLDFYHYIVTKPH